MILHSTLPLVVPIANSQFSLYQQMEQECHFLIVDLSKDSSQSCSSRLACQQTERNRNSLPPSQEVANLELPSLIMLFSLLEYRSSLPYNCPFWQGVPPSVLISPSWLRNRHGMKHEHMLISADFMLEGSLSRELLASLILSLFSQFYIILLYPITHSHNRPPNSIITWHFWPLQQHSCPICGFLINFYYIFGHSSLHLQSQTYMLSRLAARSVRHIGFLKRNLSEADPEIYKNIINEKDRQVNGINLIASENYCSNACFAAVGSVLNNKYSEGYPGARYYGGTVFVDEIESLCQKRALQAFSLSPNQWGVNVQSLSGSPANFAVYTGLLQPHDRIMSLDLPHGGHLSHGFQSMGKKISAVSKYFEVFPYFLNEKTGTIDYEQFHKNALIYRPKLVVAGASAYSRLFDYKKFRQICDEIGAYLLADMAHPAGLIAAGLIPSPFQHAHVVTTTTHKTLRGPRGSLIFYRVGSYQGAKGEQHKYDLKQKIDSAVFPGLQGGPHNHSIAGIAVALKEARSEQFKDYQKQVLLNIKRICSRLMENGYKIVSEGTDNHLILVDMKSKGLDGARMELLTNEINIYINKNTVPGDKSALSPSAIRIGSPAMTTRGLKQKDFDTVYQFIQRTTQLCKKVKSKCKQNKLAEYKANLAEQVNGQQLQTLKKQIIHFAHQFPTPGGLL